MSAVWDISIALAALAGLVLVLRRACRGARRKDVADSDITSRVFDPRFRLDKSR